MNSKPQSGGESPGLEGTSRHEGKANITCYKSRIGSNIVQDFSEKYDDIILARQFTAPIFHLHNCGEARMPSDDINLMSYS